MAWPGSLSSRRSRRSSDFLYQRQQDLKVSEPRRLMVTGLLYVLPVLLPNSCRNGKKICNSTLTKANPFKDGTRLVYWQIASSVIDRGSISDRERIRPRPAKHADRGLYRPLRTGFTDVVGRCPQAQVRGPPTTSASISFRLPNEDTPALAPIPIAARERPSNSARSRAARSFRTRACKRQDSSPVRPRKSENGQGFLRRYLRSARRRPGTKPPSQFKRHREPVLQPGTAQNNDILPDRVVPTKIDALIEGPQRALRANPIPAALLHGLFIDHLTRELEFIAVLERQLNR